MKAICILDHLPERCGDCPLHGWELNHMICMPAGRREIEATNKEDWCPLKPEPEESKFSWVTETEWQSGFYDGWMTFYREIFD